jgi:hypothetical protein
MRPLLNGGTLGGRADALSSSYVEYRTFGFWARDGALEVWLYLLGIAAHDLPSAPPWLLEAAAHWKEQSIGGYSGAIDVHLDDYVIDQDRIDVVRDLAQRQLLWLREREYVSANWLNSLYLGAPGNNHFPADPPSRPFISVGEAFLALLDGQLR